MPDVASTLDPEPFTLNPKPQTQTQQKCKTHEFQSPGTQRATLGHGSVRVSRRASIRGSVFRFFLFWFGCLIQIRGIEKLSFGLCDQGFFSLGAKLAGCEDV